MLFRSYIEFPGDIIAGSVDEEKVQWAARVPDPRRILADPRDVEAAIAALKTAEQPLIIIGKGVAYSRAEQEMRAFVERTSGAIIVLLGFLLVMNAAAVILRKRFERRW